MKYICVLTCNDYQTQLCQSFCFNCPTIWHFYRPKTTLLYKWGIIAYIEKNVHEDMQCCSTYLSMDLLILSSAQYCMIPLDILVG